MMNTQALPSVYRLRVVDDTLATSGQPTATQLREIVTAGFTIVINLALHDDPRYSLPNEAATVSSLGAKYVHIPVPFAAPTMRHLLDFFAAMESHQKERIWIHCAANIRVTIFLGLYRVLKLGWDKNRAFSQMYEYWQPDDVWSDFIAAALEH